MDKLVVGRVEAVFDDPLIIGLPVIVEGRFSPAFRLPFLYRHDRWPFVLGQVAKENEDKAVAFFDGIAVNTGPRRDLVARAERWDSLATALTVETPTVIRALHAIAPEFPCRQRCAAVNTRVTQTMCLTVRVAKQHEIVAQHAHSQWDCAETVTELRDIPEINEHRSAPLESLINSIPKSCGARGAKPSGQLHSPTL